MEYCSQHIVVLYDKYGNHKYRDYYLFGQLTILQLDDYK